MFPSFRFPCDRLEPFPSIQRVRPVRPLQLLTRRRGDTEKIEDEKIKNNKVLFGFLSSRFIFSLKFLRVSVSPRQSGGPTSCCGRRVQWMQHEGMEPRQAFVGLSATPIEAGGAARGVHRGNHRQVQPVLSHVSAGNPRAAQGRHERRGVRDAGGAGGRIRRAHDAHRPGRAVYGPAHLRAHRVLPSPQHFHAALDQRRVSRRARGRACARFAARTDHAQLRRGQEGDLRVLP